MTRPVYHSISTKEQWRGAHRSLPLFCCTDNAMIRLGSTSQLVRLRTPTEPGRHAVVGNREERSNLSSTSQRNSLGQVWKSSWPSAKGFLGPIEAYPQCLPSLWSTCRRPVHVSSRASPNERKNVRVNSRVQRRVCLLSEWPCGIKTGRKLSMTTILSYVCAQGVVQGTET